MRGGDDPTWLHTYPLRSIDLDVGVVALRGQMLSAVRCAGHTHMLTPDATRDLIGALGRSLAVVTGQTP